MRLAIANRKSHLVLPPRFTTASYHCVLVLRFVTACHRCERPAPMRVAAAVYHCEFAIAFCSMGHKEVIVALIVGPLLKKCSRQLLLASVTFSAFWHSVWPLRLATAFCHYILPLCFGTAFCQCVLPLPNAGDVWFYYCVLPPHLIPAFWCCHLL